MKSQLNANYEISLTESCKHVSEKLKVFLGFLMWFHVAIAYLQSPNELSVDGYHPLLNLGTYYNVFMALKCG